MSKWGDKAAGVNGVVAAARLRDGMLDRLLYAKSMPEQEAEELNGAIEELERRYPVLEDVEPGDAEVFAREQGHGRKAHGPRGAPPQAKPGEATFGQRSRPPKRAGGARRGGGGARRRPTPAARARTRSGSSSRRYADRSWQQTGIPGAARSASETIMSTLGLTVGLSLLFLLLSNAQSAARGRSAVEQIGGGVSKAMKRFVSPVDPLAPATARARLDLAPVAAGVSGLSAGIAAGASRMDAGTSARRRAGQAGAAAAKRRSRLQPIDVTPSTT